MRKSTRTNDPVAMRSRVLDAAAQAFQTAGFAATSTHDLMRLAGVSGGALHHHFPTKKALALAVINERVAAELGDTWVATVRDASNAAEGILQVFASVTAALDERGAVQGCPVGNLALELSLTDPDLRLALAGQYQIWRDAIAERVRRDRENGQAGFAADPAAFADVVVALFSGAMTMAKAAQSTAALKSAAHHLRAIMRG